MITINPISPVAADIFGFQIRWYALAYIAAFVVGAWIIRRLSRAENRGNKYFDDLCAAIIIGTIAGGRLGYVLFYNLPFFLHYPWEIPMVWHGGMSFHGGLLGVIIATYFFARKQQKSQGSCNGAFQNTLGILDTISVAAPVGLFFGRIANFINMEVMGRITARPWGVVFAGTNEPPRHASPLYEAGLEGVLLFVIMLLLWRTRLRERPGALAGAFGIFYGVFRIFCEQFREPDAQLGFLFGTDWITMGTILSAGMIIAGAALIALSRRAGRARYLAAGFAAV